MPNVRGVSIHFLAVFTICLFSTVVFGITSQHNKKLSAAMRNLDNIVYLELKDGVVAIELFPKLAPMHVARIKELVSDGFYDNVPFHRVIEGFMAQTGDPTGTGTGGSGQNIKAEFSSATHKRGVVSMARASSVDSADSQFFIVLEDSPFLDNQYTVWGRVISGMEYVDKIKKGSKSNNGLVPKPDKVISMVIASKVKK